MTVMTFRSIAAAALFVLSSTSLASAGYDFFLSTQLNIAGVADGTLIGTFSTNGTGSSVGQLTTFNFTASPANGNIGGFDYTNANSYISQSDLPNGLQVLRFDGLAAVELIFAGGLTPTGGTLSTNSYETEQSIGTRSVGPGSFVVPAVPEPASIALTSSALAIALVGKRLHRRRSALGDANRAT